MTEERGRQDREGEKKIGKREWRLEKKVRAEGRSRRLEEKARRGGKRRRQKQKVRGEGKRSWQQKEASGAVRAREGGTRSRYEEQEGMRRRQ